MPPWLTALSSMATNNSGYVFVGLVGFAYRFGIHSLWLSIAWILVQQAESARPRMAMALLPEIVVGLILAAIFATLSTADSQVLSCSAAITQDMYPRFKFWQEVQ